MRVWILFLPFWTANCAHPSVRHQDPVRTNPATETTNISKDVALGEVVADLSSLRMVQRQVPSNTEVTIELTLTNAGSSPITITMNPRQGHRDICGRYRNDEIEIQIMDMRGRVVPYRCTELPGLYRPTFSPLRPGQSHSITFSLDRHCYSLIPGERLAFIATYANLPRKGAPQPTPTSVVQPSGWIDVIVPSEWPDRDATQPGVADGPGPRLRSEPGR
jgi:hypothetical protein